MGESHSPNCRSQALVRCALSNRIIHYSPLCRLLTQGLVLSGSLCLDPPSEVCAWLPPSLPSVFAQIHPWGWWSPCCSRQTATTLIPSQYSFPAVLLPRILNAL